MINLKTSRDFYKNKYDIVVKQLEELENSIPELVNFVTIDAKSGNNPCIYKRGNLWRYHTQRAGNQWYDHEDPATAALLARIKS